MQYLIIDLDHTLLDTTAFKAALAKSLQLSESQWDTAYEHYVQDYGNFNPKDFLQGVPSDQRNAFEAVMNKIQQFLYPDSLDFIQRQMAAGWDVTVLTFGDQQWQQQKLDHLELPNGVHAVATDQPKTEWLRQQNYQADDRIVMIDDHATNIDEIKQQLPKAELYWMRRPNGKYQDVQPEQDASEIEGLGTEQIKF